MTLEMIMDLSVDVKGITWGTVGILSILLALFAAFIIRFTDRPPKLVYSIVSGFFTFVLIVLTLTYFVVEDKIDNWRDTYVIPYVIELEADETFDVEEFVEIEGELYATYKDGERSVRVTNVSGTEFNLYDRLAIDVNKPENYIVSKKSVYNGLLGGRYYFPFFVDVYWVFEKE